MPAAAAVNETRRAAIVTGAVGGIGAEIARRLAADGLAVAINYLDDRARAEARVAEIETAGGSAVAVRADVSDAADVAALFDRCEEAFGRVDILVNNAAYRTAAKVPITDLSDVDFDQTFAVNAKGCFLTLREAARRLSDGGRIVNISTHSITRAPPGYAAYAASKAMVETFTRILARELGGRNITVNAVAPGPTDTPFYFEGKTQADVDAIIDRTPLRRLGQPRDIAEVVAFLAGPGGAWVNGQIIGVNGGIG